MYSRYPPFSDRIYKYALPFCGLSFILLMCPSKHTGFHFDEVQVISFFVVTCAVGIILKKSFTSPESQRFTPVFSSKNFCTFGS